MIRTVEAIIDKHGRVRLLEEVKLPKSCRALVTILEEAPRADVSDTALLSELALAKDWQRPIAGRTVRIEGTACKLHCAMEQ